MAERSSQRWWIIGAAGVLVLAVVAAGAFIVVRSARANSDEARIRRLVADFALATERVDQAWVLRLLCTEEAEEVQESDGYAPTRDGEYDTSVTEAPVTTSDIKVTQDTAQARISRPGQESSTLFFRKENGSWTVCAPVGDEPG